MKYGRRECEACEGRLVNIRIEDGILIGDCVEHGVSPAWITGIRQNSEDET